MGKRELVIIGAFVAIGVIAYQLAAPPPKPGERRFSISDVFNGIKREMSSNAASATVEKTGTIAVRATVTELRVRTERSVPLTIIGEERDDIAYEMPVESNGPDEATAKEWAGRSGLREDDLGAALALATRFPEEGTQRAKLTLRVPARLTVRVENSGRIHVSKVAAVELRNISGEATVTGVAGAVTGSHRSGDLNILGVGSADLTLQSSRAKFRDVRRGLTLTARSGDCSVGESSGPFEAVLTNAEFEITAHDGPVKISGEGGQLTVIRPAGELSVDVRRMLVEATLRGGPSTIITTDEPLRVAIDGKAALAIDAIATDGGDIRAADVGGAPVIEEKTARLMLAVGAGGARTVLRNARGDIVIGKGK